MRKLLPVFLLLLVYVQPLSAQQSDADSLIALLPDAKNDTVKARLYNGIFNKLVNIDYNQALYYAYKGLAQSEKMKWGKGIAVFRSNIGQVYSNRGQFDSAMYFYNLSLAENLKNKDKRNAASDYNNMGTAAFNIKADYPAALDYNLRALKLSEEIKDSLLTATCFNNISAIFLHQQNYEKALEYARKALLIRQRSGSMEDIARSYQVIGKVYYQQKDTVSARENFNQALQIAESEGQKQGIAEAWSAIALCYGNNFRAVLEARIKAMEIWNEINPLYIEAITNLGNLGIACLDSVRYGGPGKTGRGSLKPAVRTKLLQQAEEYISTAIRFSEQTGETDNRSFFLGALSELQEYKGNYKEALFNYKLFREIQDSIFSQENKNKIAAAESQLLVDKKNNELKISSLRVANQQRTIWGIAIGAFLLAGIGYLFYRQAAIRKKTNKTLNLLNKELDAANQAKATLFTIINHDLRAPVSRLMNLLQLQQNAPELVQEQEMELHWRRISAEGASLLHNMENMLWWSKSQMEKFSPQTETLTVAALFDYIKKFFSTEEQVRLQFIGDTGLRVDTDGEYLKIIMQNLTANAINALKQTEQGSVQWEASQESGKIKLTIKDNGPGFSPEQLQQLQGGEVSLHGKSGFGLYIIKEMAKAIQCRIVADNHKSGARVVIEIVQNH